MSLHVALLGVPFGWVYPADASVDTENVVQSPAILRREQFFADMSEITVTDYGDLDTTPLDPPDLKSLAPHFDQLTRRAEAMLAEANSDLVLIYGGACPLAYGSTAAFAKRFSDGHLLWIDGHADFETQKTTKSHYIGGMALSTVVGVNELPPAIAPARVTLLAAPGADWTEISFMRSAGVRHVYPQDVMRFVAEALPETDLMLHLDLDCLDYSVMPSVNFPSRPGLSLETACAVLRTAVFTDRLRLLEVTSYDPMLDPQQVGLRTIRTLLSTVAKAYLDCRSPTRSPHPTDETFVPVHS
ncbi:MAG: arginase family protein [Firmicutes bacterium]|nr:arginase family protein [Bacillota bacterium]